MSDDCVFCRIVAGTLPGAILDRGPRSTVILDHNQAARGHLLVLAKRHVTLFHELDAETAAELGAMAHKWAGVLVRALAPAGYNVLVNNGKSAGQEVPHVHVHVVPKTAPGGAKMVVLADAERQALVDGLLAAAHGG